MAGTPRSPRKILRNDNVRFLRSVRYDGALTIFEVGDCLQDVAVDVERLWTTDSTGGVPARVQDDLGVDEVPGRYSLVQGLAESSSSCHIRRGWGRQFSSRTVYIPRCEIVLTRG